MAALDEALLNASILDLVTVSSPEYGTLHLSAHVDSGGDGISWQTVNVEDEELLLLHMKTKVWVAPMLRDVERNIKYEEAISRVIKSLPLEGRHVLDIGTGTGLLSMMAVRAGAATVVAVEMFPWVSEMAKSVITSNKDINQEVIKVICTHSTELTVKESEEYNPNQMCRKADVLISELLDSTLLREGVLPTVRDAWNRLLKPGAKVIPCKARILAVLVQSADIRAMHHVSELHDMTASPLLSREDESQDCPGTTTEPVRLQSLEDLVFLSEPFVAFDFDFSSQDSLPPLEGRHRIHKVDIIESGSKPDVLYWWDAVLCEGSNGEEDVIYSTEPGSQTWQDHWLHAAHPLASTESVKAGDTVSLEVSHNELEVWFKLAPETQRNKRPRTGESLTDIKPQCTCGLHSLYDTKRIECMSGVDKLCRFTSAIQRHLNKFTHPSSLLSLDVSDGSYLSLITSMVAKASANTATMQCVSLEEKSQSQLLWGQFAQHHAEKHDGVDILMARASQVDMRGVDILLFDGFVKGLDQLSLLSALHFFHLNQALSARGSLSETSRIVPQAARIMCCALMCPQVLASYGKVGDVCGFNHSALDTVLDNIFGVPLTSECRKVSPLYLAMSEYMSTEVPNTRLAIATFDYKHLVMKDGDDKNVTISRFVSTIRVDHTADLVVFWVEYDLGFGFHVSTGPAIRGQKQAVRLLREGTVPTGPLSFNSSRPNLPLSGSKSDHFDVEISMDFSQGVIEIGASKKL